MQCKPNTNPTIALLEPDIALAKMCKALGNESRIMIVRLLLSKKQCVCGRIVDELPLSQSTVSQHLKVLKEADIIQGEIKGPSTSYCINPTSLALLKNLIGTLTKVETMEEGEAELLKNKL